MRSTTMRGQKFKSRILGPKHERTKTEPSNTSSQQPLRNGFSSDYLNLADKYRANILAISSTQGQGRSQRDRLPRYPKIGKFQTGQQLSREAYRWESPIDYRTKLSQKLKMRANYNQQHRSTSKSTISRKSNNLFFRESMLRWNSEQTCKLKLDQPDMLINLARHSHRLLGLRLALQKCDQKISIKVIKQYVLGDQGSSIVRLDKAFSEQNVGLNIRKLVLFERIVVVAVTLNIISGRVGTLWQELGRAVEMIVGFWYQIIANTYQQNLFKMQIEDKSDIVQLIKEHAQAKLLTRSNISQLLISLQGKTQYLFKFHTQFYQKISPLLTTNANINRSFYDILGIFATCLTQVQAKSSLSHASLSFFTTCPSPYLIRPTQKPYTLVVDLDQTLLYSVQSDSQSDQQSKKRYQTIYRPHCLEFLGELSSYYEIIIFTTSLQNYAKQAISGLNYIDGLLCRQHAIRLRYGFVKDISRIGRQLTRVVIVDDIRNNFRLQKENGVCIKSWKGDQNDKQLVKVKELLLAVARARKDVRISLKQLNEKQQISPEKGSNLARTLNLQKLKTIQQQCKLQNTGQETIPKIGQLIIPKTGQEAIPRAGKQLKLSAEQQPISNSLQNKPLMALQIVPTDINL